MNKEEKKNIAAETMNILLDFGIEAKTGDWHDYERVKKLMQWERYWTPDEWEEMCRVAAAYLDL